VSADQRCRLAVGGKASHAPELDRSVPGVDKRSKLLGGCLRLQAAGSSQALRSATPDLAITAIRHLLHWHSRTLSWTRSHADVCRYPLRLIRTNGRRLVWRQLGPDDSLTPTTSVAILSLHQRPGFVMRHFPHWPCRSAVCPGRRRSLHQHLPWWRSAKNEAVVRQLVNVLMRPADAALSTTVGT
jgi:hypothetical protein